jgi:hypothetical protein
MENPVFLPDSQKLDETCTESDIGKGPFLYYVRVFGGFTEPPTHLRKVIFTT